MFAVIMAGGGGTRLWPESRKNSPKQVKPFIGKNTLLQETFSRLRLKFPVEDIIVTANISQKQFIADQLPELPTSNYSLEPDKRDTAAAIGLATIKLFAKDKNSSMININSDAYVTNPENYIKCINVLEKCLDDNPEFLVGIGIKPTHPETGYGYIKKGELLSKYNGKTVFHMDKFVEKPNKETALSYLSSGEYLWNPTLFCWKTKTMLDLFRSHAPELYNGLMEIYKGIKESKEDEAVNAIYPTLPKISIDYAIFEKATKMAVLEADFGWSDVGSWSAIKEIQDPSQGNVIKGDVCLLDSQNCLIYAKDRLIAGSGLKNMIVVDTGDALLICPKDRSQDVKNIVASLEKENRIEYL